MSLDAQWHAERGLQPSVERPPLPGGGPQTIAEILDRRHPNGRAAVFPCAPLQIPVVVER